jgi:hypothetical protein
MPECAAPLLALRHVPPICALPPSNAYRLIAPLVSHKVMEASAPANGAGTTEMVNVALAAGQLPAPGTVYWYVPWGVLTGKKNPLMTEDEGSGPRQVPFRAGDPNSSSTIAKTPSVLQRVMVLEMPALGAALTETVTVAVRSVQGGIPATR